MRTLKKCLPTLLLSLLTMGFVGGCVVYARPPEVVVEPGYYYDGPFVDGYGVYHPRVYYYYHGGFWDHRDFVPRGYAVRERYRRR